MIHLSFPVLHLCCYLSLIECVMTFIRNGKVLSIKHFKGFGQYILVFKSTAIKGNRPWLNLPPTEIFVFSTRYNYKCTNSKEEPLQRI